ncbi:allatostatin double C isoform X3 [Rhodnius prolixus]|uniref:allatostatin double C isoform X3 n=1 Tax=Rhodnius prolixus TaxID=13249 RepID=UPI003D18E011
MDLNTLKLRLIVLGVIFAYLMNTCIAEDENTKVNAINEVGENTKVNAINGVSEIFKVNTTKVVSKKKIVKKKVHKPKPKTTRKPKCLDDFFACIMRTSPVFVL